MLFFCWGFSFHLLLKFFVSDHETFNWQLCLTFYCPNFAFRIPPQTWAVDGGFSWGGRLVWGTPPVLDWTSKARSLNTSWLPLVHWTLLGRGCLNLLYALQGLFGGGELKAASVCPVNGKDGGAVGVIPLDVGDLDASTRISFVSIVSLQYTTCGAHIIWKEA